MKWLEFSIRTTPEYVEPISELFRRYGESGVVVEEVGDWDPDATSGELPPPTSVTVRTYIPLDATAQSRREMVDIGVRLISLLQPMGDLEERELDEDEWEAAWKSHFTLLRVGKRLAIKPTWQEYTPADGEEVVELDPGMAFGTGHHPTTRMCLEELERRILPGMRVLDLGTGSAILAVAAAKLGAAEVVALDIAFEVLPVARANVASNGVAQKVRVLGGTLPHEQVQRASFDLVVANITAQAIVDLAYSIADVLAPSGVVAASGILVEYQAGVEEALSNESLEIVERRHDDDWALLVACRV
ncbi:MAG: 50S ribosomal protein L11 methyltransferase [Dehalococcoidia bacterium]|nr:50S ribosomal protein L11 methyltransferase [Dehalococcoidia bacterium]